MLHGTHSLVPGATVHRKSLLRVARCGKTAYSKQIARLAALSIDGPDVPGGVRVVYERHLTNPTEFADNAADKLLHTAPK